MQISQLINNDMKDSSHLSSMSDLTIAAVALPVIALLAIMAGVFVSDGSVLAKESPESTRISADLNESYFTTDQSSNTQLAQSGGLLEPKSEEASSSENNSAVDNGDTDNQCESVYLRDHLRIDFNNDRAEVLKLQSFLKTFENYDYVNLTGSFDESTLRAVKAFQSRYADDILAPWGYQADEATGYVYITTKKKINEIYCDEQFLLSQADQTEIREYRQKLNMWRAQGASFETPNYLAEYYGQTTVSQQPTTDDEVDVDQDDTTTDDVGSVDTATSATTTATSSQSDDRSFFERLFGIGGDDEGATTSTSTADESEETPTTTTDEEDTDTTATSATTTATSSGIDQLASGVYEGINSIVNFLLSPTFLLAVLIILILLLIATLIEGKEDNGNGDDVMDSEDNPDPDTDDDSDPEVEYVETKAWKSDNKSSGSESSKKGTGSDKGNKSQKTKEDSSSNKSSGSNKKSDNTKS